MPRDTLTDRERKRLDRFEKMQQNRRGRSSPAVMPSKLARTAAFAPRKKNLVTDSDFKRVYEFRPHTVVEVSGRELGTQHRDALYALFKLRAKRTEEPNPLYNPNISAVGLKAPKPTLIYYHTITTWRDILKATGRSAHVNNLGTVLRTFEEMRKVNFRVYTGTFDQYQAASKRGRLAGPGFSDNLLNEIEWSGVELDSPVRVRYGAWVKEMFETKTLVSVNSEIYFKLKSDYAKSLWPAIDFAEQLHLDRRRGRGRSLRPGLRRADHPAKGQTARGNPAGLRGHGGRWWAGIMALGADRVGPGENVPLPLCPRPAPPRCAGDGYAC